MRRTSCGGAPRADDGDEVALAVPVDVLGVHCEHAPGHLEALDLERRAIGGGPCSDCKNRQTECQTHAARVSDDSP